MRKILFEIEIENVGAARRIEALREEIRRLNKELKGADVGSDAFKELITKITDAKFETAELKEEQKKLNREFQSAKFPKDSLQGLRIEYAKLTDQIKILSAAERASPFGQSLIANAANVKKQIDGIEQSIGRFTGNVGNYRSAFDGLNNVLLSIGAGFGVNEIIQQNTRLSDSIANVAKTTGLTIEEAEKLAEVLKFRDTRTNLADQLKITEIGGQLGIATDQLQAFTEGVDVLNVALGDQFGNVDNLTREFAGLRNVLTDFKTADAADDILKLGNAVNFLEAQGNATGQSIVDFAGRIAGAGVPLGATTEQIIGLSTTLSELSINPERGATAVSRLLTEVARSPEVFAQAIGEPADKFTKLVQTDIVGALALVSEKIATSSTTNTVFANTLETLGIGAQGAIEVFGKLGGSTDLLRQRIGEAGQTLQNTDSITREFEVKNNNAAAAVEKLRNAITGALTGTDAQDAIAAIAGSLTDLIGVLGDTFEFLKENELVAIEFAAALIYLNRQGILVAIPLLRTLGVSLGILVVNETGAVVATNTLTTAQGRAAISAGVQATATRALALAQSALPFVAVIAATYALVQAWDAYEASASASEKAARTLADAQEDIAKESAKEVEAVRKNIEILKTDVENKEARQKAISDLKSAYPDYLRGLDLEKASVQELSRLQDQLTESIIRSVAERRKATAQEEIAGKIIEQTLEVRRLERLAPTQVQAQDVGQFVGATAVAQQATENAARSQTKALNDARAELQKLQQELELTGRAFDDAFSIGSGEQGLTQQQRDLAGFTTDLSGQFSDFSKAGEVAAGVTKKAGDESESTGDKIKGLGSKTKGAKDEINAQAGSVAALRDEISKLEKQIEATDPGSPALEELNKRLAETKKRLVETEKALLASTFKSLFGRDLVAPEIDVSQQPDLTISPELAFEPDAKEKILQDAKAIKDSVQAALSAVEFPVEVPETDAAKKFREEQEKGNEALNKQREEDAAAELKRREDIQQQVVDSAITSAQTISDSLTQIQTNRLQRETDAALAQLDSETEGKIAAAQGNEAKIKQIEKESAIKRAAIEKEAARQRKQIAVKEAIINTALAITKALTGAPPPVNLILAGVAAAAGAAQLAVINSQEFSEGGVVRRENKRTKQGDRLVYVSEFADGGTVEEHNKRKRKGDVLISVSKFADGGTVTDRVVRFSRNDVTEQIEEFAAGGSVKRLKPGVIREPQNAPRTAGGDTVLAYLAPGEMVLNEGQQNTLRSLYGQDAFALAGVPGEASTRRSNIPGFASGGVVGIVPQNGFAQQVSSQPVTVDARAEFSGDQIDELGQSMGTIIAAEVSRQLRVGLAEGLFDANRRLEREAVLEQNRQG